ncbi:hypothetical protein V6N11_037605 [Hibiscus sabdariffa]|uniref:DUF4283 domain-containing protein n=1 Tax=Hibiscus sabdariffa TaxID=183260 RepID=A0ABR2PBT2_9ROSI
MECDAPMTARKIVSYKDIVVGPNDPHQSPKSIDLDDDNIELLEDDIAFGLMNDIPTIDFSERVQNLAIESMDLTLFVKVLGRWISYNTLHNRICGIWKPSHPLKLIDIENDFFLRRDVEPHVSDKVLGTTLAPSNSIPDEAFGYWISSKKIVSISHVTKKLVTSGSKASKQSQAVLKNPMHSSRTPSHLHESSTSKHTHSIPKASVVTLDPVKHHTVQLQPNDHPRIPVEAISGGRVHHGSEAMLE